MSKLGRPSIDIKGRIPMFGIIGIFIFLGCIAFISNLTNTSDGLSILDIFTTIIIILISILFFISLCLLIIGRAFIQITDDAISQWRFTKTISIGWDEIQEFETIFGARLVKSSGRVIEIYLEDFSDPTKVIEEIESRLPANVIRT